MKVLTFTKMSVSRIFKYLIQLYLLVSSPLLLQFLEFDIIVLSVPNTNPVYLIKSFKKRDYNLSEPAKSLS